MRELVKQKDKVSEKSHIGSRGAGWQEFKDLGKDMNELQTSIPCFQCQFL